MNYNLMMQHFNKIGIYKIQEYELEETKQSKQFQNLQDSAFQQKRSQYSQKINESYKFQREENDNFSPAAQIVDLTQLKQQQNEQLRKAYEQDQIINGNQNQVQAVYPQEVQMQQSIAKKQIQQQEMSYPPEVVLQQSNGKIIGQNQLNVQDQYITQKQEQQYDEQIPQQKAQLTQFDKSQQQDYKLLQQSLSVPVENLTRKDNLVEADPTCITIKRVEKSQVDNAPQKTITKTQQIKKDQDNMQSNTQFVRNVIQKEKQQPQQHQNLTLTGTNEQEEDIPINNVQTITTISTKMNHEHQQQEDYNNTVQHQSFSMQSQQLINQQPSSQQLNAQHVQQQASQLEQQQDQQPLQSAPQTTNSVNREEIEDLRKEIQVLKDKLQQVYQEREVIQRSIQGNIDTNNSNNNNLNNNQQINTIPQTYTQQDNYFDQNDTLQPQVESQIDNQTDIQQYTNNNQNVHKDTTPRINQQQYQQLMKNIGDLSNEIENLENTQILLQNRQSVLKQDQMNQKRLNQQFTEELAMQEFSQSPDFIYAYNNFMLEKLQNMRDTLLEQRKNAHMHLEDLKGNIRVAIRLRPQLQSEMQNQGILDNEMQIISDQQLQLTYNGSQQEYNFYKVFGPNSSQVQVFTELKPLIQSVLDGQNVFIGAIGQTSSGKTYTTIGDTSAQNSTSKIGLMPRAVVELYKQIRQQGINAEIQLAMLELYNDQLIDLINDNLTDENKQQEKLTISKMPNSDFSVKNLTYQACRSPQALINLLGTGLQKRHVAETKMNINSSRSHTIIYIKVQTEMGSSLLTFADLAGSERLKSSQSSGQRLKEAQYINKSLSALGDVIQALATKKDFVPFRNNKLTMLLQPSMSGNCKSLIICCLCPNEEMIGETYQTLQFAKRGSQVVTREQ